jgi:signal transduction histidine kinase
MAGFSELLAKNCRNYDIDKIQKMAMAINHDALISTELLKNLLLWARGQSGTFVFNPDRINVYGCVDEIRDLFSSSASLRNVELKVIVSGDVHLYADRNMICTIIRNLLSNAHKFTPANGFVSITLDGENDQYLLLSVADSGIGMSPEQITNLFKNTGRSTNGIRGEHGTGLGLYLCREFIDRHEGSLTIESVPQKGSCFTANIPRKPILKNNSPA